jgi:hypothetical protein
MHKSQPYTTPTRPCRCAICLLTCWQSAGRVASRLHRHLAQVTSCCTAMTADDHQRQACLRFCTPGCAQTHSAASSQVRSLPHAAAAQTRYSVLLVYQLCGQEDAQLSPLAGTAYPCACLCLLPREQHMTPTTTTTNALRSSRSSGRGLMQPAQRLMRITARTGTHAGIA